MVVAHDDGGAGGPHVLFYGHYDVQPVDPLSEWTSPPFEPRIETAADGSKRIRARGAADDKGQLMTFVEACRAWKAVTGALAGQGLDPLRGRGGIRQPRASRPSSKANAAELTCRRRARLRHRHVEPRAAGDHHDAARPRRRGGHVTAADRDLHSGGYGSAARNPIHVLADVLAALHDAERHRHAFPASMTASARSRPRSRRIWDSLDFDGAEFLGDVGLSIPAGEKGRSVLEKIWSRPTARGERHHRRLYRRRLQDRHSVQGLGKGLLPPRRRPGSRRGSASSSAPSSATHIPADCKVEFKAHGGSPALRLPFDGPYLTEGARRARRRMGRGRRRSSAAAARSRWSATSSALLGMDSLMIGFGLDDDRIHSPNEKYDLSTFHGGIRSWARVIAALAE